MVSALMETVGRQACESSTDTPGRKTEAFHAISHEPRDPRVSGGCALWTWRMPRGLGWGRRG